jgi:AraC-like DNA-binding protein
MKLLTFLNDSHFNIYDLIIFMLIFQAIIFCGLLLSRQDRHISHYLLMSFIGSIGLGQFCFFCLYNPYGSGLLSHIFGEIGFSLMTSIFYIQGILLYSYIKTLAYGCYRFSPVNLLPLSFLLLLAILLPLIWNPLLITLFWRPFVLVSVVGFFVSVVYGIKSLFFISRYSEQLKNHFCNLEQMKFFWLQLFAVGYLAIWILQILPPFFYSWAPWWFEQVVMHSAGFLNLVMMNFVFFAGLVHARKIKSIKEPLAEPTIETPIFSDSTSFAELKKALDQRIRAEALYAKPNLNIERLARLVAMPVRQLSNLINREFQQNYFEFINYYRLEAVKEHLSSQDWSDKSIQEIYESVGFCSKSTFFTLFRKQMGMTPMEYREKMRFEFTS